MHENEKNLPSYPEAHLAELLGSLPGLVVEADRAGKILYLNRTPHPFTAESVLGSLLWEWIEVSQVEELKDLWERCFTTGRSLAYTFSSRADLVPHRTYAARFSAIRQPAGVDSAVVFCQEITAQVEMQEALAAAEERWRVLVESMPDHVVLADEHDRLILVNRVVAELGSQSLLGSPVYDLLDPEDIPACRSALRAARQTGVTQLFTVRVPFAGEEVRIFHCRASAVPRTYGEDVVLILASDATQHVLAEAARAQSEASLRQVIDLVPHLIFARNREGRFLLVNEATAKAYGCTVEALTGRLTSEVHGDAQELVEYLQDDQQVYKTLRASYCPLRSFTNLLGEKRLLQTHKIPFMLPGATDHAVLGVAIDVTEQHRVIAALQRSEEQFRNLVENINDIIFVHDLDGIIRYISPVVERVGMYKVSELVGRPFTDFVHPEDLPALLESQALTLAGIQDPAEFRVFNKDGGVHYVRTSSRLLLEDGQTTGLTGVMTDITGQKRSEAALQLSEQRYQSIYNLAPLAILLWKEDGSIIDWNAQAEKLFGWRREEVLGKRFCDFGVPPGSRDQVLGVLRNLRHGRNSWSVNENITRDGQTILCEWNSSVQRDEAGAVVHIVSVAIDVTERHREMEQRRKLDEQIQHTQKLESLGVLAGGIAHDFNNLLVGIIGNTDFVLSDLPQESPLREHLEDVGLAAQRAADLCRQLLAYSGKGRFVVLPLDLRDLVLEMTQLMELSIARKATLRLHFAEKLPAIDADATQLRQVIMNLVSNASEAFDGHSGTVSVRVEPVWCGPDYFRGSYLRTELPAGEYVVLEVKDDGCGMDATTLQKIFEPFFTTKFAGRGLGLAAVLGIVRSHRGGIRVASEPGQGTCIRIYFPVCAEESLYLETPTSEPQHWVGEGHVLVVDDEPAVLRAAEKFLSRLGYQVIPAVDGQEAVELFARHTPQLKLVILDMTMPRLSGPEVFQRIRAISPTVPVLLTSGYSEAEALACFSGEDPAGFLQKPYTQQEFLAKVWQTLASESSIIGT